MQKYLTRHEAARFLRCHVLTIDRRIADGSLRTYSLGRKVLIDETDLRRLLVSRGGGKP
jgi:excisionase family DNA binding protein